MGTTPRGLALLLSIRVPDGQDWKEALWCDGTCHPPLPPLSHLLVRTEVTEGPRRLQVTGQGSRDPLQGQGQHTVGSFSGTSSAEVGGARPHPVRSQTPDPEAKRTGQEE